MTASLIIQIQSSVVLLCVYYSLIEPLKAERFLCCRNKARVTHLLSLNSSVNHLLSLNSSFTHLLSLNVSVTHLLSLNLSVTHLLWLNPSVTDLLSLFQVLLIYCR